MTVMNKAFSRIRVLKVGGLPIRMKKITRISDLQSDDRNANKGTFRGNAAIEASLRKYGAGRSILLDKNGKIIAGNKTAANAVAAGLEDVIVVPTDGTKIIAVQRTDLDLNDPKARELAIADNRAAELSLEWDVPVLSELCADLDLQPFFTADELTELLPADTHQQPDDSSAKEIDTDSFVMECKCPKCGFEFDPPKKERL